MNWTESLHIVATLVFQHFLLDGHEVVFKLQENLDNLDVATACGNVCITEECPLGHVLCGVERLERC